ncbi:dihydrodipicolinate synthase family protein [Paenibacillus agricola]|uniref:Dihydrodipicolinate synthase family protein n=1 Tax=Paenibacillus agricola TaxID=2716264 RepID=A0ABX0J8B1_9BACL|nr:dihydrodipicolinate synthase family protein [Paenibacillus agricola]NHN32677.1 dihydrodipicolinate synthase family protein [Paenibacillus agricola]
MIRFEGVYVAIVTPFTSSLEVDYARLKQHADWLVNQGVHGIIPTGSVGEYAALLDDEREKVVEAVMDTVAGRIPVVVGSAAPSTQKAVRWVTHAKQAGAAGVMALPPINYRPTKKEAYAHYEALSGVGLPIIAYNNPFDTAIDMTPDFLAELSAIDNVVAVKEFSADVRRIYEILERSDLEVMAGVDDLSVEGIIAGATGWIGGLSNVMPKESVRLFELSREGKINEAMELYRRVLPLFRYDSTPRLVQAIKYAMGLAGMPVGETRPPRLPLENDEKLAVERTFIQAQGS